MLHAILYPTGWDKSTKKAQISLGLIGELGGGVLLEEFGTHAVADCEHSQVLDALSLVEGRPCGGVGRGRTGELVLSPAPDLEFCEGLHGSGLASPQVRADGPVEQGVLRDSTGLRTFREAFQRRDRQIESGHLGELIRKRTRTTATTADFGIGIGTHVLVFPCVGVGLFQSEHSILS